MKKVIFSSLMAMFMFVGLTSMVNHSPPSNSTCSDQCAVLVGNSIFSTQGECMSACNVCTNSSNSGATQIAVCVCNQEGSIHDGWPNHAGQNMGQCVKNIKNILSGS
jgi:hypothetical protein